VRGRHGGLLQFSEGEAVMILLASVSSGILGNDVTPRQTDTAVDMFIFFAESKGVVANKKALQGGGRGVP